MIVVNGREIADNALKELKREISAMGRSLVLAVVQIGSDKASASFIKQKQDTAAKLGVGFKLFRFQENITTREARKRLAQIAQDKKNNGIIIQLPLPPHLNSQYLLDAIPLEKDVDVLSSAALGKFYTGKSEVLPPVTGAVLRLLKQYGIKVPSQTITIVGAGRLVGKPLAIELLRQGATVICLSKKTASLKSYTLLADILVSGAGQAHLIKSTMLKKGVIVIDAGLSQEKSATGKSSSVLYGDVDPKNIEKKARIFAPAVGGLGPITVAMLFQNLLILNHSKKRN